MLTLYERSITSKFCSFRVLSQEFGGKSKKIGGYLGTRDSLFGCKYGSYYGLSNYQYDIFRREEESLEEAEEVV